MRFLASVKGRTSILTLVLAGVVVSAFFESAISIIKLLADPHQKLPAITYWLMGSIAATNYRDLALMALAIVPPSIVIFLLRYQINILSLGEDKARALGSPIETVQWTIFVAVSFISAGVVATSGIVGWVGLVIPHIARALVGAGSWPAAAGLGADRRDLPAAGRQSRAHRDNRGDADRHHHRADRRAVLRGHPAPDPIQERLGQ